MVAAVSTHRLLGVYFSAQSQTDSVLEITGRTAECRMWQQQQLLQEQEEIQQQWKQDTGEEEEEDTEQLVLEDQFLEEFQTV